MQLMLWLLHRMLLRMRLRLRLQHAGCHRCVIRLSGRLLPLLRRCLARRLQRLLPFLILEIRIR